MCVAVYVEPKRIKARVYRRRLVKNERTLVGHALQEIDKLVSANNVVTQQIGAIAILGPRQSLKRAIQPVGPSGTVEAKLLRLAIPTKERQESGEGILFLLSNSASLLRYWNEKELSVPRDDIEVNGLKSRCKRTGDHKRSDTVI